MLKTKNEQLPGKNRYWWPVLIQIILLVSGEFLLGAIWSWKNLSFDCWQNEMKNFQWLVLVKGDMVTVDEVGRFLSELDGVKETKLLDRAQILEKLSQEQLWPEDAALQGSDSIPQTWLVQWDENPRSLSDQKSLLADIQKKDGVVDVAFDPHSLERIRLWRKMWLTSRIALAGALFLLILILGVIAGKLIFSSHRRKPSWPIIGKVMGVNVGAWALGYGIAGIAFGFLPVFFLAGGVLTGIFQILWQQSEN